MGWETEDTRMDERCGGMEESGGWFRVGVFFEFLLFEFPRFGQGIKTTVQRGEEKVGEDGRREDQWSRVLPFLAVFCSSVFRFLCAVVQKSKRELALHCFQPLEH